MLYGKTSFVFAQKYDLITLCRKQVSDSYCSYFLYCVLCNISSFI